MAERPTDQITIIDLSDGYSVMLSDYAISMNGGVNTLGARQTFVVTVTALHGEERVTPTIGTLVCPTNVSAVVGTAVNHDVPITITFEAALSASGSIVIPVQVDDIQINKEFSFSISFRGSSVTITGVRYGTSDDASTEPQTWSTTAPTSIDNGKWLWVETTYSDNSVTITKSYIGTDGEDGKSVFIQSATKVGDTTTIVLVDSDGNETTLTINDGEDGDNGTPGAGGYVHVAWANSADGSVDFSTSVSANKKYLGVYTDNTEADSQNYHDYSWSLIKGADGDDAYAYDLIVSHAAIVKAEDGTFSPSAITLTAKRGQGTTIAPTNYSGRFKIETTSNGSTWTQQYPVSPSTGTDQSSYTYTLPSGIMAVRCSLYLAGGMTTLLDQQTVPVVTDGEDGKDAYTVILTNESHTFAGSSTAAIGGTTTCGVITYKGATQISCYVGASASATSISTGIAGLQCTIANNNSTNVLLTFTASDQGTMITPSGTVSIPVTTSDGKTFTKLFSFAISFSGESARVYSISVSPDAVVRGESGTLNPASITLSATTRVGNGSSGSYSGFFKIEYSSNGTSWVSDYNTSLNNGESSKTYTIPSTSTITLIRCSLYSDKNQTKLLDSQTVPIVKEGSDTYTVFLSNESHTFPGTTSTAVNNSTATTSVSMYKGATKVQCYVGASTTANRIDTGIAGLSCNISNNNSTNVSLTFTALNTLQAQSGVVSIRVRSSDGAVDFTRDFSFTVAYVGGEGEPAYTVFLTNENHTFPGGTSTATSGAQATTNVIVYRGTTQLKCWVGQSNQSTTMSTGITNMSCSIANNNTVNTALTFLIGDNMQTPSGSVPIQIHTEDGKTFSKTFTFSVAYTGASGESPYIYTLNVSPNSVVRANATDGGGLTPTSITLTSMRAQGTGSPSASTGYFKVEYSSNGSSWTTLNATSTTTTSATYSLSSLPSTTTLLRCSLYLESGKTTLLDTQTVPIITNGNNGTNGANGKMLYGTSSTNSASTAAKPVICADASSLYAGFTITVKFSTPNTAAAPTLNVNSLGAKAIWVDGAVTSSSNYLFWGAGAVITFMYDGTQFLVVDQPATYYTACATLANTAAKVAVISGCVVRKGTTVILQMTNAHTSSSAATLCVVGDSAGTAQTGTAKTIYNNGATITSGNGWAAGSAVTLIFDGQYWRVSRIDNNALVTIEITSVDWQEGTVNLKASLRVDGSNVTPTSYSWTRGTNTNVLSNTDTCTVSDANDIFYCTVTW